MRYIVIAPYKPGTEEISMSCIASDVRKALWLYYWALSRPGRGFTVCEIPEIFKIKEHGLDVFIRGYLMAGIQIMSEPDRFNSKLTRYYIREGVQLPTIVRPIS
jgi:hypothetical protein